MFSCCLRTTQGSGHKKNNKEGHGSVWRHRVHSCLHHFWPFYRKKAKKDKGKNGSASEDQRESCTVSCMSADTLKKLVNHLVPSLQSGDPFFVPAFLSTYRRFATTLQVLNLLFKRYEYFCPNSEEDEQVKTTLCSFLDTWMDKNPEDFCQTSDTLPLQYLKTYLSMNMPDSDLNIRVNRLMVQLQKEQTNVSQAKVEEDSDLGSNTSSYSELEEHQPTGKTAILEPESTCAPELESTKTATGSVTHEDLLPDVSAAVQPSH
ncbi:ral guanine nucleotide dissociation stimulator-like [Apodemus sylvaticus]|uniref:ral guanine nucleotide dissociation stimulator-like n=1 Tax=Apodemus sylvaticus TaxID=10129 RepID=UPI002243DF5B|nr:ral guanine nucleotide dissociation stimulator-like [Apodemus sylvaticus]